MHSGARSQDLARERKERKERVPGKEDGIRITIQEREIGLSQAGISQDRQRVERIRALRMCCRSGSHSQDCVGSAAESVTHRLTAQSAVEDGSETARSAESEATESRSAQRGRAKAA